MEENWHLKRRICLSFIYLNWSKWWEIVNLTNLSHYFLKIHDMILLKIWGQCEEIIFLITSQFVCHNVWIPYICKFFNICVLYFQNGFAHDLKIKTGTRISLEPFIAQTSAYMQNEREDIGQFWKLQTIS